MPPRPDGFERNVFINCPFDDDYQPLARALIFSVLACGFEPRLATERSDSGEVRIEKIRELIRCSLFSVHDLSRIEPLHPGDLPRFNMPFELGLDLGSRYYGNPHLKKKQCLILEEERYRFQRVLSDISGNDIRAHQSNPETLIRELRNWLLVASKEKLPSAGQLWRESVLFQDHLLVTLGRSGYSELDVQRLETAEYISILKKWLAERG